MQAQADFDQKYVSSTELCQVLGVTREGLRTGRRRRGLPDPIKLERPDGGVLVMLWEREVIQPHVDRWLAERG